ncbi:MAG: hypothetical protein GF418_04715 [Chitinivibrionales bacterium]|nr:hypothetical protein [Chitinivibrionales bacterium]MBD3394911.1 hypothetical protein [Chitinivibrionales bacterium]
MDKLVNLIRSSHHCVAFTGAGVSTLSGIRGFRGKNGIYQDQHIDEDKLFDLEYFRKYPSYYYGHARNYIYSFENARPCIVHTELARLEQAVMEARRADFMLVLGSTLVVQPAASMPLHTLQNGGSIAIVNDSETPLDSHADLRYHDLESVFRHISAALAG